MTALADPTTTPGYDRLSSAGQSATARSGQPTHDPKVLSFTIDPSPAWAHEVESRINELLALGPDWDTYGARPLDVQLVVEGVRLLVRLAPFDAPAPWIVPTVGRGVQLEWDGDDLDVAARVDDQGTHLYVLDDAGEDEGDPRYRPDLCARATRAIGQL